MPPLRAGLFFPSTCEEHADTEVLGGGVVAGLDDDDDDDDDGFVGAFSFFVTTDVFEG